MRLNVWYSLYSTLFVAFLYQFSQHLHYSIYFI
jgi:hypothetical protein